MGVPPRDIYEALFIEDENGRDMLERKRDEIDQLLSEAMDLDETHYYCTESTICFAKCIAPEHVCGEDKYKGCTSC